MTAGADPTRRRSGVVEVAGDPARRWHAIAASDFRGVLHGGVLARRIAAEAARMGRWRALGRALEGRRTRSTLCARAGRAAALARRDRLRRRRAAGRAGGARARARARRLRALPAGDRARPPARVPGGAAARGLRRRSRARRGRLVRPRGALARARARPRAGAAAAPRPRGWRRHVLVEVPLEDNRSAARAGQARRGGADRPPARVRPRRGPVAVLAVAGLDVRAELTDPLPYAHHAFFAETRGDRATAALKTGVRWTAWRGAPRAAERFFTVHYAAIAFRT